MNKEQQVQVLVQAIENLANWKCTNPNHLSGDVCRKEKNKQMQRLRDQLERLLDKSVDDLPEYQCFYCDEVGTQGELLISNRVGPYWFCVECGLAKNQGGQDGSNDMMYNIERR